MYTSFIHFYFEVIIFIQAKALSISNIIDNTSNNTNHETMKEKGKKK